jgi:biotin carboxylase
VKCEHKYWSRLEQQRVIDEYPRFGLVDIDGEPALPDGLSYPVWVKPVKSVSSALAFRVEDGQQLRQAAAAMRDGIGRMGDPFDFVLSHLQLPPEVTGIGGRACLAEEAATGAQVTVEGYSFHGDVHVYGTVDSITCPDSSSFLRYQYPSSLPSAVTQRMAEISERVIKQIGLDGITFNIEYFWDPDHDTISLLEVNPRHSQSHAELFEQVDGVANHDHMLQLALGREPRLRHREGPYHIAAKWFVRRVADGVASRVPTSQEIEQVERAIPGCTVDVTVTTGDRLSELYDQDSYSYALATVYVGADDEDELIRKYEQALAGLPFEFEEPTG